MQTLARQIRFSINPFLDTDELGSNGYASNPPGEGLAIFLGLWIELTGDIDKDTGFVVNVVEIDRLARELAVPILSERIRKNFRAQKHTPISELAEILKNCMAELGDKFLPAKLKKLKLDLNPYRNIAIEAESRNMVYFSEKFSFAATHKLWNDQFTDEENFKTFGKCANPTGHGHNYVAEITLKSAGGDFKIGDIEQLIDTEFIQAVDHKNLNVDVAEFAANIPTVENIAKFAWQKLAGRFGKDKLHCVTVWETDKTYCSYFG